MYMFWGEIKHRAGSYRCCQSHDSKQNKSTSASAIFVELQSELWIAKKSMSTACRDFCSDHSHVPSLDLQLTADLIRFSKKVHISQILNNSQMNSAMSWHKFFPPGWHSTPALCLGCFTPYPLQQCAGVRKLRREEPWRGRAPVEQQGQSAESWELNGYVQRYERNTSCKDTGDDTVLALRRKW